MNETGGKQAEPTCPQCGLAASEWSGQGYAREGQIYCCQGCAEGTGCICKTRKECKSDRKLDLGGESNDTPAGTAGQTADKQPRSQKQETDEQTRI
ncbi:MAG TPA: hypothetical protein VFC07_11555 [Verrucomicrobiae bacterium]|nr:hypothetical protein [Verrucomicrobiae bacterium]